MSAIDKEAALKLVSDPHNPYHRIVREFLLTAPTVDAEPVRQGRWVVRGQEIYCSERNEESLYNPFGASKFSDFCPNCGADMREGGAEQASLLDRLAAEYDRKHPNGLKFTYSLDGEVQQTEQEEKENEI